MSEEALDANLASASSAEATPADSLETPAGAQPVTESTAKETNVPFHENPRFQELIREKNEYKSRIEQLEARVAESLNKQNTGDLESATAKELLDLGIKEDAANKMASRFVKTANEAASARVSQIEKVVQQLKLDNMIRNFADEHSDFNEIQPQMFQLYNSLDPQTQAFVALSPQGLNMLYNQAKANSVESIKKTEYERGVKQGLTKKQEKEALASSTGAAAVTSPKGSQFSDEAIASMSLEDFMKNKEAIYKARGMRPKF